MMKRTLGLVGAAFLCCGAFGGAAQAAHLVLDNNNCAYYQAAPVTYLSVDENDDFPSVELRLEQQIRPVLRQVITTGTPRFVQVQGHKIRITQSVAKRYYAQPQSIVTLSGNQVRVLGNSVNEITVNFS